MMTFCLVTINQYALVGMNWSILISCRRSTSLTCTTELPWQLLLGVFVSVWVVFAVHWYVFSYGRFRT
ncbi:uncharacterized protein EDB91DRAFT_1125394 [Suillus paluster]|uniref:uncharacterized protein n=1 Tax=Suillus paluster TaxID=48578 RepID=UPI001B86D67B|nr:uncharacterized protein EDB91DRAFT_1125394 [Suillus paluster]KAG1743687.1 hypothetical protein EDB91DRAFT_1125394 [Suillus paluster]